MNHKQIKLLVVFCTGLLLSSALIAAGSVLVTSESEEQIVRVDIECAEDVRILNEQDLDIMARSGRHALVETDEETIESLRALGMTVNTLPERTEISVKGHTFDFTEGGPGLDSDLKIDRYPDGSTGTYIVHMLGPVDPEWRAQLEDMGVEILNYVPNYAYEVRMTPEKRDSVESLDFVDWTGIYHPGYRVNENIEPGRIKVQLVPDADVEAVNRDLRNALGVNSEIIFIETNSGWKTTLRVNEIPSVHEIAKIDDVYYISPYREPELHSEVDSQIIGGGTWIMDDEDGNPETSYRKHGDHGAYINQLGYTGEGVTVAVADTGIGDGTEGDAGHPDFENRVVGGYSYSGQGEWQDGHSHGTHTSGSIAANAYNGTGTQYAGLDGEYYPAEGLAHDSNLYAMKIFSDDGQFLPSDYFEIVERPARVSDSYIHSNSWGSDSGGEYTEPDQAYDEAVRDAHGVVPTNVPMVITASAGNAGPDEQTIGSPAGAKNIITVGATETYMPNAGNYGGSSVNNPDNVVDFSSRGWTQDNRVKPDVVAPGASVLSTMTPEDTGGGGGRGGGYSPAEDEKPYEFGGGYTEDGRYEWMSGTSMSNPAVAGAAAVVVEWYEENYGETPSPAMVKSLLINTANDLDDGNGNTGPIPNQDEGWGMVDLSKLEYPKDDPVPLRVYDQPRQMQTGEVDEYQVMTGGNDEPLKISLVWTDKYAQAGDNPTLKNDLNLQVESPSDNLYRGNAFSGGWTQAGENAMSTFDSSGDGWDDTNTVENVYIHPDEVEDGVYNISVEGFDIPADANQDGNASQDYALVVYNAPVGPDVEITSPAYGDVVRQSDVTVEWTSERSENHEVRLDEEEWIDVGMNTTYTFENVEDWDNHRVEVRATDFLGENTTESVTFSVWTVGVEVRSPEEEEIYNQKNVTVEWSSEHAEYHEIRINEGRWINVSGNTTHTFEEVEDGDHTVEVRATDVVGYQSVTDVNFTVDTSPPHLEITSPEEGHASPNRSVTIEWEGSDELSGIEQYEIRTNEDDWEDIGLDTSYEYEDLADGDYEVEVRATDRAGHQETDNLSFIIDTLSPIVTINELEEGDMINSDSIPVNWSAWDDISEIDEKEIRIDEGADGEWGDWIELSSESDYTFEDLPDDEHIIEVRAVDVAGNEETTRVSFIVDTTPPDLQITSPSEDELRTDFVTVEWECKENETGIDRYEIKIDDGEWETVEGRSHKFEGLEDGSYTVEVRATDQAGNNETSTVSFEVNQSILHIYWAQYWWLILPILVIVAIIVAVGVVKKVRGPKDEEETPPSKEPREGYKEWTKTKGSPKEGLASGTKGASASAGAVSTQRSKDRGESCPTCGSQMEWYDSTKKWYCKNCQQYKNIEERDSTWQRETSRKKGTTQQRGTAQQGTKQQRGRGTKKQPRETAQQKTAKQTTAQQRGGSAGSAAPAPSAEEKDVERQGTKTSREESEEGGKDEDENRCPLCGIKVDPDSEECWACGNDLTEEE
ncbi:MAG: S8 family serine peptidase [Candidatus Thermoplasmatota archaeon]